MNQVVYEVNSEKRSKLGPNQAPDQLVPEKEKDFLWYYQNARYISSYYNQLPSALDWPAVPGAGSNYATTATSTGLTEILQPAQKHIRMLQYYLGEQPNVDAAFAQEDMTEDTIQAMLIKSQTVKEFVDFFKGSMMSRLSNANWTAKPLSKRATNARTDMFDKAMLAYDLKPYLQQLASQTGATFDPTGRSFELPEQVQRYMETDWKEYGVEILSTLANGIWFTDGMMEKALKNFLYTVCTSDVAFHVYAKNGRMTSEVVLPYKLIKDGRVDNDFGMYDQFIGKIDCATPMELKKLFPGLTQKQYDELKVMADKSDMALQYAEAGNAFPWVNMPGGGRGTINYTTCYFRTKHFSGVREVKRDKDSQPRIAKIKSSAEQDFVYDDIASVTLIGNRYVTNTGYIDNLTETVGDVSRPMMPILRFQPNTVLGQSKSEVERIHKLVSECDYLGAKIRAAVGKAKGKVYIVWGDKFNADNTPKEFLDNLTKIGVHTMPKGNGEIDGDDTQLVSELDWTLDPNIMKYHELIVANEEKMKKIMSTSDLAMGSPQTYFGNNTMQTAINQNTIGTAPLFDGYMNFLVLVMRYMANATKNLMLLGDEENTEMSFYVGDRGMAFIKLFEDLTFEQIGIALNINDTLDSERKKNILQAAQMLGQTTGLTFEDYLNAEMAGSVTEIKNELDFAAKRRKQEATQQSAAEQQAQQANIDRQKQWEAMIADNKEANANWRKEADVTMKGFSEVLNQLMTLMPPPLASQTGADQQQQPAA